MTCPSCHSATKVVESRHAEDGATVRRRRKCPACGHRFTTHERRDPEPLWIGKRGGERERFDRAKLRAALLRAAHKRPVSAADVEGVVGRIEAQVASAGGELGSEEVARHCLEELRDLDRGAYLQFAGTLPAFSPQFGDLEVPPAGPGSVRSASNHERSTPKAAPRRGLDG